MSASRNINMTSGSLWDKLLLFALPLAVTGILQQLFNAADIAVVGQFVGKNAMAAVGSNSPIIGLVVNLFLGVSLGANVVIATFTGQGNREGVRRAVHTSLLVAVLGGVAMAALGELIARPLLSSLSVPPEVLDMAVGYLRIYVAGLPVMFLYNFESAVFRSQGDTRTPLACLCASGVINVGLNLFFVLALGMAVDGVALATVLSNLVSAALLFVLLVRHPGDIRVRPREFALHGDVLARMFRIGAPAGLQSMVFSLSNICIQGAINSLGADIMAASAAAFNIEILAYFVLNAFGQACTTFTGQNYGAGNVPRCRRVLRVCLLQDCVAITLLSALLLAIGRPLLGVFNGDPVVVRYGMVRLGFILVPEVISSLIEVVSGALRGYGCSLVPALTALLGVCGVRIAWVYTAFAARRTFDTLLVAYPLSWCVTAAAVSCAYAVYRRKHLRHSGAPAAGER